MKSLEKTVNKISKSSINKNSEKIYDGASDAMWTVVGLAAATYLSLEYSPVIAVPILSVLAAKYD